MDHRAQKVKEGKSFDRAIIAAECNRSRIKISQSLLPREALIAIKPNLHKDTLCLSRANVNHELEPRTETKLAGSR